MAQVSFRPKADIRYGRFDLKLETLTVRTTIYWMDHPKGYRLGIMGRPRAGEWLRDEVEAWKQAGVDTVVSLLDPDEVEDLELGAEADLCRASGIEFVSFPIPDRGLPSDADEARLLAERLCALGTEGKAVAIHCRAGIGRSSIVAGAALVISGLTATEALEAIGDARGLKVPDTVEQREWLNEFYERDRSA